MNTLNKLSFIGLFAVALGLISCNKESPDPVMSETEMASTGLTISQAEELANLFAPLLDSNGDLYLKRLPKMYINLSRYEMPANN